jgi:hypothetical protein
MEYLTLQDIPYRQYQPSHAHRMASSHTSEGPLGSMNTAVRHPDSSDDTFDRSTLKRFLPLAFTSYPEPPPKRLNLGFRRDTPDSHEYQDLISAQNIRSSPPIQPGEVGYADKLPSFSEVCNKHHNQATVGVNCSSSFVRQGHAHTRRREHHRAGTAQMTALPVCGLRWMISNGPMAIAGVTTPLASSSDSPHALCTPVTYCL